MFIGITETLCAGAADVADYLVAQGFKALEVDGQPDPRQGSMTFQSPDEMLAYVTSHWYDDFVTLVALNQEQVEAFTKRPFFMLLAVTGPVTSRLERYKKINPKATLEEFVKRSEATLYGNECMLVQKIERAHLKLINDTKSVDALEKQLTELNLRDAERLRPAWDQYFMALADLAALRSNCMKRRVGAVIVRENRVIATGYNGTPRHFKNCNEGGCPRCNSADSCGVGLSTCLCLHAEENALLEAGRDRIGDKATVYCNTCPCLTCSIKIVQAGISEVVYSQSYSMDKLSAQVFQQAGITLRQYVPPQSGVVLLKD